MANKVSGCLHPVAGLSLIATLTTLSIWSNQVCALDVDPGDYTALDPGTKMGLLYLQHAERDGLYANGSKVQGHNVLDSNIGILRGVSYQNLGNTLTNLQVLLPFGQLKGRDDSSALGSQSGIGDPILAGAYWLYDNPSKGRSLAITQYLYLPLGEYHRGDPLNLGENRWKYVFQGGYIHGFNQQWFLDVTADVTVFGKNDDYTYEGLDMKQRPQYQAQSYLRYKATPKLELYVGASRLWGGETEVAGVMQSDQPDQKKFMVGASYFIAPKTQVLATCGQDFSVENGFKEENRLNFRLLHVF